MNKHVLVSALLLVVAAGCEREVQGGEEAEAPEAQLMHDTLVAAATPAADTVGTVTVILEEWTVRAATDTLASAGPTTFRVRNNGDYPHILEVEGQGMEWVTDTIAPGDWTLLETDLEPGSYELYCPIDGEEGDHSEFGMVTYLVVLGGG